MVRNPLRYVYLPQAAFESLIRLTCLFVYVCACIFVHTLVNLLSCCLVLRFKYQGAISLVLAYNKLYSSSRQKAHNYDWIFEFFLSFFFFGQESLSLILKKGNVYRIAGRTFLRFWLWLDLVYSFICLANQITVWPMLHELQINQYHSWL